VIGPDLRLVRLAAAWTVASAASIVWPALVPAWLVASVFAALAAAADAVRLARAPAIDVRRTIPERAILGRDATIVVTLRNPGPRDVDVEVVDELPADVAATEPRHANVRITADATIELREPIRPAVRGDLRLGPVIVLERSPLGLWRRRRVVATDEVLRVYPDASRYVRTESLRPNRILALLGARPARERGAGMEFESLRDYVVGDDVRRIDWAASARRGRLVTRLYQHERNRTVLIALDASRLMATVVDGRTKLDHAVEAALVLAYGAVTAGDRVGMLVFDDRVRAALEPAPRRHLGAFVDVLRTVQPRPVEADYVALARRVAAQRRSALVIVLSDFVEADTATLVEPLVMLARRHRILFAAIRDRLFATLTPAPEEGALAPYRRLVLDELLVEREATLARLRRAGVEALDVAPERITAPVLNAYLAMRQAAA
jgi:uncharacterized protein (DUF58 family)